MARHRSSALALLIAALHADVLLASSQGQAALAEDDACLGGTCALGLLQTSVEKQVNLTVHHAAAAATAPLEHGVGSERNAFLNETMSGQLLLQLEYELDVNATVATKNPVILALIELFVFPGIFGCDRCYMGQTCVGTVKAVTCGGVLVWALVDYIAVVVTCLSLSPGINALGMRAKFHSHAVPAAFIVTMMIFAATISYLLMQARSYTLAPRRHAEQVLIASFVNADSDRSGFLSVEELNRELHYSGIFLEEKRFAQLIKETGTASDGKVDYKKFARLLASKH